jgi:hypothetical protein
MGLIFENLIRRFNELANETAGDHFTPREVIRLMVHILFIHDDKLLATPGTVRKMLDPACGTGGMLAESENYLREHHSAAKLYAYPRAGVEQRPGNRQIPRPCLRQACVLSLFRLLPSEILILMILPRQFPSGLKRD